MLSKSHNFYIFNIVWMWLQAQLLDWYQFSKLQHCDVIKEMGENDFLWFVNSLFPHVFVLP